jgi:hypothetical protein
VVIGVSELTMYASANRCSNCANCPEFCVPYRLNWMVASTWVSG